MKEMKKYAVMFLLMFIAGCSENIQTIEGRWYSQAQIEKGAAIFRSHCASCHGSSAQGLAEDWKKPLADGSYPPPPLNGSAHTWHHSLEVLKITIRNGSIPLGGKMPPFKDKLNDDEIESVLAFIQSLWSDEIYSAWKERDGLD